MWDEFKMNKSLLIRIIALFGVMVFLSACSASGSIGKRPQLSTDFSQHDTAFSFSASHSQLLNFSEASASTVQAAVDQIRPEYAYEDMYQLEEVKKRLDFDAAVENHQFSALNEAGKMDAAHLSTMVQENNRSFLADKPFGYQSVEDDYIAELCEFIVYIVDTMHQKYPDIDWPRVYCNLGNLKILYDTGMLSYAEVSQEMVLSISKNNTQIVLTMKGQDGFSRVLTHEIMHIIQIGCVCEQIENCGRRAGIAVYWDDFTLNTTDWTWMVEGSAERHMCKLTGGEAVSYQYKMDYLCSLTMAVLLRDAVKADTMETLCFYDDPQLLFDAFGCETEAQRDELLNMMITLQVLQMQPQSFHLAYAEKTGVNLKEDSDAMDQFSYSLKPAICITLAKEFYENLIPFLRENELSCNDLFFLLNLFEGHLNQHLNYTNAAKAQINQPYVAAYTTMRSALFAALEEDNPGLELSKLYTDYDITAAGENLLNAQLGMLPAEKLAFLAERAQWQSDQRGLGQKVPNT